MMIRRVVKVGMIAVSLASASLYIAAPQTRPLAFEVASIKPNAEGDNRVMMRRAPGGRLIVTGANLKMLIRNAYRVQDFQIIGGPSWMGSDRWDIQAKAEENVSPNEVNEMMQTLLADRFQLKFHKETRELPVYELFVAKDGPKLKETGTESSIPPQANIQVPGGGTAAVGRATMVTIGGGQISGSAMSMTQLIQALANNLGRTVIDKTGLTGSYDIKLEWRPDPGQGPAFPGAPPGGGGAGSPPPIDPSLPSIFTAIQEQLGLKIESAKGPVEVLVIDGAEKPVEQQ